MTGSELDKLVIKIVADTKQLTAGLNKVKGDLGGVGNQSAKTGDRAKRSFGGMKAKLLAVAAAGAVVTQALKKIAGAGMVFEDLKDSLDIVFGGMAQGDEALAKITQFAQTTPFQIDDVTKAFIGLKSAGIEPTTKMLQTFADTASVATDQKGTFEALVTFFQRSAAGGASLVELNRINDRGIDIFGRLEKEIGKSRLELSTFGQTAEGSKQIQEGLLKVLERDFGGAMASKMDNLSTKASNMQIAFKVLGDELFKSGIGNMLKGMADRMTSIADSIARALRDMRNERKLSDFGIDEQKLTGETITLSDGSELELKTAKTTEELLKEVQDRLDVMRARMEADQKFLQDQMKFSAKDHLDLGRVSNILDQDDDILELKKQEIKLVEKLNREKQKQLTLDEEGKKTATTDQISELAKLQKILEDSVPIAQKIEEQVKSIQGMKDVVDKDGNLFFTEEELDRMVKFVQAGLPEEMEEVATMSAHMQDAIANAAQAFSADFVNALMDGENALDSFQDFSKQIVSQIITTFLQLAVVNTILNSIFGQGSFDTLSFKKGEGFSVVKANTDDNSAGGGRVHSGVATLVGERGPEIFVPHSSGSIMNGMLTKGMMGGGPPIVVEQHLNFATGVVPTVRAEVQNMMPQIAEVAKGAVLEASARGGAYRRGLMGG